MLTTKSIYSVIGIMIGIVLGFLPGIDDVFWHRTNYADLLIIRFGVAGACVQMLGLFLPYAIMGGMFFGIIGFAWRQRVEDADAQRNKQKIDPASQETENVWPPPPSTTQ